MRYSIIFVLLSLLFAGKVYAFLPSESSFENFLPSSVFLPTTKTENIENNSEDSDKQSKKQINKNKKEFRKAFRKAMFEKWKKNIYTKKDTSSQKQIHEDIERPSVISIISFITGLSFFALGLLLIAGILSAPLINALLGILAVLGIIGLLTGIIGLFTMNKEKHNTQKTTIYSLVGIASGIVLFLFFVLIILALNAAFG